MRREKFYFVSGEQQWRGKYEEEFQVDIVIFNIKKIEDGNGKRKWRQE